MWSRVLAALVFIAAIVAYRNWQPRANSVERESAAIPEVSAFACEGKTRCSQMRSCEEATFYITHCPNTQMDGDHDGIPCESQWCSGDAP